MLRSTTAKQKEREQIKKDIEAFLSKGKEIAILPIEPNRQNKLNTPAFNDGWDIDELP